MSWRRSASIVGVEVGADAALAGADAIILHGRFRSRGTRDFYQVRVGAATRHESEEICRRLQHAGAACLVLRNAHGTAVANAWIGSSPSPRPPTT